MGEDKLIDKLEFYQQLLLEMMDLNKFPFYHLLIKTGLSKKDMNDIIFLCKELNEKYEEQCEQGFVYFTPLLVEFVGMLPSVLSPKETIISLKEQQYYPELMEVLLKEIENIE